MTKNEGEFNMDNPKGFSLVTKEGIEPMVAYCLPNGKIAMPKKAILAVEYEDATVVWDDTGDTWYDKGIRR